VAEDKLEAVFSDAAGEPITIDVEVHEAELNAVHRNRAIAHLLKHLGLITDIERTLEVYSYACALNVTSGNLALMAATLANKGINPVTNVLVFQDTHHIQHALSHMLVSGMYGESGQWVVDVGCPAKSGVSGGLLLSVPNRYGIGIFSPRLDDIGNSVRGIEVANMLDDTLDIHVVPL
jgi:glutaminase